ETPARLVLFDILAAEGAVLTDRPLRERRQALDAFVHKAKFPDCIAEADVTLRRAQAQTWLDRSGDGRFDGVIGKPLAGRYASGERAMTKVKKLATADCVVGGFRYQSASRQVGSLLLGLYDRTGKLNHVGFTSTISDAERPALTRRLKALREPPGF